MRRFLFLSVKLRLAFCLAASLVTAAVLLAPSVLSAEAKGVKLPIIMYHSVLREPSRTGLYVISPEALESDLAFLSQRGYTAILPSELYEAVSKGGPLPEKPVMITFDDGFLNNLTYALPLLEKYDMKALVSPVASCCECFSLRPDPNPAYASLSWEDILELTAGGRVEIGNHSYDMHKKDGRKGIRRMPGEDEAEYYRALVCDIGAAQSLFEEHCGIVPTAFAYPFGSVCREAVPILREMGFTVFLTCAEKVNMITNDTDCLLSLGRFNRSGTVSTERFMKKLGIV